MVDKKINKHPKIEDIINDVVGLGYNFISHESNAYNQIMAHISDSYGYKYFVVLSSLKRGSLPRIVSKSSPYSLDNISKWILLNKRSFLLYGDNEYNGNKSKLNFLCEICHDSFVSNWHSIRSSGCGCSVCSGMQIGTSNSLLKRFPKIAQELSEKNNFKSHEVSYGSGKKAIWECNKCRCEWTASMSSRTSQNSGCPYCIQSKGEYAIIKVLLDKNIEFSQQKTFRGCADKYLLRFDFYLPEYNLCIEYNGIQHYEQRDFFGGKSSFIDRQAKDKIKKDFCVSSGIEFIQISYKNFNAIKDIILRKING